MTPIPVMATRRFKSFEDSENLLAASRLWLRLRFGDDQLTNTFYHLAHGLDVPGFFVGNRDIELAFEIKKHVDAVQRVQTQVGERALDGYALDWDSLLLRNHGENPGGYRFDTRDLIRIFGHVRSWVLCNRNIVDEITK
jgi:hypothetical protein